MKRFYSLVIVTAYAFNLQAMYHGGAIASSSSDARPVTAAAIAAAIPTSTSTALSSTAAEPKIIIRGMFTSWELNRSDVNKCGFFKPILALNPDSTELYLPRTISDNAFTHFKEILECKEESFITNLLHQIENVNTLVALSKAADFLEAEKIFNESLAVLFKKLVNGTTVFEYFKTNELPLNYDNPLTNTLIAKLPEQFLTSELFDYWSRIVQNANQLPLENVIKIEWSPCGQYVAWQTNTKMLHCKRFDFINLPSRAIARCDCFSYSPKENLIALGQPEEVCIINPENPAVKLYSVPATRPELVSWNPLGELLAICHDTGELFLWDYKQNLPIDIPLTPHLVRSISWLENNCFACTYNDRSVHIFEIDDTLTLTEIATISGNENPTTPISCSSTHLCTHNGSTATVWDKNGGVVATLNGHAAKINQATFNCTEDLIATASDDFTVKIWSLDGVCLQTLRLGYPHTTSAIYQVTWHQTNANKLITLATNNVTVWDLNFSLIHLLSQSKSLEQTLLYGLARYVTERKTKISELSPHIRTILRSLPGPLRTIMKDAIFQPQAAAKPSAQPAPSSSYSLPPSRMRGLRG